MANTATRMSIGRANAVFVFGQGENTTSIVSSVVVRVTDQSNMGRIRFTGSVSFDNNTVEHFFESVLPAADNILMAIGLQKKCFEISIVNFEVASIKGLCSKISGYSADVPFFIATLSACLHIPVQEDVLFTGHIASPDGDIRMVKNLPSKLSAVVKSKSIKTFIHPTIDADHSLTSLSPSEKQRIEHAVEAASQKIRLIPVRDVENLVRIVFNEQQVIMACIKQGYFDSQISQSCGISPCANAADYFSKNIEERFWNVLENQLLSAKVYDAKKLLQAFISFHIEQKRYPKLLGTQLSNLIYSLPPEIRHLKLKYPLISISKHIQLTQYARKADYEDVRSLFMAVFKETAWCPHQTVKLDKAKKVTDDITHHDVLQFIRSEINEEKTTFLIGMPINLARESHILNSVIVDSFEEFNEHLTSFYIHLIKRTRGLLTSIDLNSAGADALALLERAFSQMGGYKGAFAEAKCGKLRYVFNVMTEQCKQEEEEKYVKYVLRSVLDPMKWEVKVEVMKDLLTKLKDHLPGEIIAKPPEQLAANMDVVLISYSKSIDKITSLFRSF